MGVVVVASLKKKKEKKINFLVAAFSLEIQGDNLQGGWISVKGRSTEAQNSDLMNYDLMTF